MDKNRLVLNNRINRLKILELNVYIFHNKFTKETMIVAAMNPELACNAATSIIPDILDNSKVSGTFMKYNSGYPSDKNKDGIVLFNNYNIKLVNRINKMSIKKIKINTKLSPILSI